MTPLSRLLSGERVRIDYHGRTVDVTSLRRPIDHVRLDDVRGGRIQLRYLLQADLPAWLSRHAESVEKNAMKKMVLLAALGLAATFAPPAVLAQDALTIYTPTATYSYAGTALGVEAADGSRGGAGYVLFGTYGIAPVIDGPHFVAEKWPPGGWTVELSPEQTSVSGCQLQALAYLESSGMHVYLRCASGAPQ